MKLFRLYIGSRHSEGSFSNLEIRETVGSTLLPSFPSLTLMSEEGWFRGASESGMMVIIATDDVRSLLYATEELRIKLRQEGVGVEFASHYHRVVEGGDLSALEQKILEPVAP